MGMKYNNGKNIKINSRTLSRMRNNDAEKLYALPKFTQSSRKKSHNSQTSTLSFGDKKGSNTFDGTKNESKKKQLSRFARAKAKNLAKIKKDLKNSPDKSDTSLAYETSEKSIKIPRIELEKLGIVMAEKSKASFHAENLARK